MRVPGLLASLLASVLGTGCADADQTGETPANARLTEQDLGAEWIRMPVPSGDALGQIEALVKTSRGYAALFRKQLGMGKAVAGWENRVFTSIDGAQWIQHEVPLAPSSYFRDLAYGDGRLVLAGAQGLAGIVATSSDAAEWTLREGPAEDLRAIEFINGKFFALSNRTSIWQSSDGVRWAGTATQTVQLNAIAYGDGKYVAVGSGPIEVSHDGTTWTPVSLDCAVPANCITDPDGNALQGYTTRIFYAEGAFHAEALTSRDALHWERAAADALIPDAYCEFSRVPET